MFSRKFTSRSLTALLACSLFSGVGLASTTALATPVLAAGQSTASQSSQKRGSNSAGLTSSQIASAKAKGMVWVNTKSRTYHTGGRYYGKTKHGKFMSLEDAKKAGYRPARH